jgi:hypothetical protein
MSEAEAEADADAVALFHPANPEALKPFLDLDEAEESEGIYAEELEDGSFLLHTFQPFAIFEENGSEAREWLAQFGDALDQVHDDPRGVLFFPDTLEPEATTYAGVVEEAAEEGVWVSLAIEAEIMPATSFDIAKMFEDVQEQLAATFGLEMGAPRQVVDAEFEPDPASSKPESTPTKK